MIIGRKRHRMSTVPALACRMCRSSPPGARAQRPRNGRRLQADRPGVSRELDVPDPQAPAHSRIAHVDGPLPIRNPASRPDELLIDDDGTSIASTPAAGTRNRHPLGYTPRYADSSTTRPARPATPSRAEIPHRPARIDQRPAGLGGHGPVLHPQPIAHDLAPVVELHGKPIPPNLIRAAAHRTRTHDPSTKPRARASPARRSATSRSSATASSNNNAKRT